MPFQKKKENVNQDRTIAIMTGRRVKAGKVGVEIELEGKKIWTEEALPGWTVHEDGSLRGEENCEYVFAKPVEFAKAKELVVALFKQLDKQKAKLDDSNRTSVHVHLNVLGFHLNRLTSLLGLWFIHEDVLTRWCGDHRTGNLFCLRAKDAPAIVEDLRSFITTQQMPRDGNHYAALNGEAIRKYGSVEFRTMRGTSSPEPILQWMAILERLYDVSENYKDPRTICDHFSMNGPVNFFYETFGADLGRVIREGVNMTEDEFRESLYEGVRFAQDLCYARDWARFNPVEVKQDVFGRTEGDEDLGVAVDLEAHVDQWGNIIRRANQVLRDAEARDGPPGRRVEFAPGHRIRVENNQVWAEPNFDPWRN